MRKGALDCKRRCYKRAGIIMACLRLGFAQRLHAALEEVTCSFNLT